MLWWYADRLGALAPTPSKNKKFFWLMNRIALQAKMERVSEENSSAMERAGERGRAGGESRRLRGKMMFIDDNRAE